MDNLIGALILLVFAVLAGLRKLVEQRQLQQEQQRRVIKPEELPEKTRQILYGDREPTAEDQEEQRRQLLEQQRGVSVPPPVRRQGPLAPTREAVEESVREAREKYERARQQARKRVARPQEGPAEAERHLAAQRRHAQVLEPRRQRAPRPGRSTRKGAPTLFQSLGDVRRGIIMSEILGPPKGLK